MLATFRDDEECAFMPGRLPLMPMSLASTTSLRSAERLSGVSRSSASTTMLEVRCFHRLSEAEVFREAMNALNAASPAPDPFSSFEFLADIAADAEAFPRADGFRPWLLLAFKGERLVGYAALKQERHRVLGLAATRIDWLAAYRIGRPHVVAQAADAAAVSAAVYAYLHGRRREWSLLAFEQQDADSGLRAPGAAFRPPRFRVSSWPDLPHWRIARHQHSLKGYFASLSDEFRSKVTRQMRDLLAEGKLELLTASEPSACAALLALYRDVERQRWKLSAGNDVGQVARARACDHGLLAGGQPKKLVVQLLVLNDLPVAGLVSGAFGSSLYALEMGYDERFSQLGPGTAMMLLGVRQAIEGHFRCFDLMHDFGNNTAHWQAERVEKRCLQIYRVGTPYFWLRCVGDARRGFASLLEGMSRWLFRPRRRSTGLDAGMPAEVSVVCDGIVATAAERAERARLLNIARSGASEHLVGKALADVLPFPAMVGDSRDAARLPATAPQRAAQVATGTHPAHSCAGSADRGSADAPPGALRLRVARPINQ